MLVTTHNTEQSAINHMAALQDGYDRFAVITENYEQVGGWLVTYEISGVKLDREQVKREQAVI